MTTASPHLRALAIVGVLAAAAVALGTWTIERQRLAAPEQPAAPAPAATAPEPIAKAKAKAAPAAKPAPRPRVDPIVRAALAAGLPKPVARAFASHGVVVATLYSSRSAVDSDAAAEARAGAKLGGAGFAAIDASREGAAGKLTRQLGLLGLPTTVVYHRPDFSVAVRLDGFADRETVAQAARDAAPAPAAPGPWARRANALCATGGGDRVLAKLRRLEPATGETSSFVAAATRSVSLREQAAAARARGDAVTAATLALAQAQAARQADGLALELGATACSGAF